MTQRNWLRTNDIDPEQDFADLCRELGIKDESPMSHIRCEGVDVQDTVWQCHTCHVYNQMG